MEFCAAIKKRWIRVIPDALEGFPWHVVEWENRNQECERNDKCLCIVQSVHAAC